LHPSSGGVSLSQGQEIDRQTGAASTVMQTLYRSVIAKRELSWKAKLSIYQSIYIPTLTNVPVGSDCKKEIANSSGGDGTYQATV